MNETKPAIFKAETEIDRMFAVLKKVDEKVVQIIACGPQASVYVFVTAHFRMKLICPLRICKTNCATFCLVCCCFHNKTTHLLFPAFTELPVELSKP